MLGAYAVIMCNWSPGWVVQHNYEVVGFQPWSGTTKDLDSFTYCCVPFLSMTYPLP